MLAAAEAVRSRRRSNKAKVDPMTPRSTQDSPDVASSSPCSDTHTSDPATRDNSQGTMSLHRRLQYLRMAIQGVEFTKNSQLMSVQKTDSSFDSVSLSLQTAAQVEDNYFRNSHNKGSMSFPIMKASVHNFENDFNIFFCGSQTRKGAPTAL